VPEHFCWQVPIGIDQQFILLLRHMQQCALRQIIGTLTTRLELNRSVHRFDQVSPSLAPEDGVRSAVEVVK
jgi:hypothetical protein